MRILTSTGPLFGRPLDWALGVLAEAGYDGAELMVTRDPATQDGEKVVEASEREGVSIGTVHGPFLLVTRRVFGTDPVVKAERSLQLAAEVGADVMVAHPPLRWQSGFHAWLTGPEGAGTANGVRVGVENLYPVTIGPRRVRFHRYTELRHLTPFPHVVLDTSHLGVAGIEIETAYQRLREQIVHLHVSDNRGGGRDSHAPLGHGRLPLGRFLARVGRDGRDGVGRLGDEGVSITLELDLRPYLEDRPALVGFLRREREKCLALLAGADAEEVLGRPDDVEAAPGATDGEREPWAPPHLPSLRG